MNRKIQLAGICLLVCVPVLRADPTTIPPVKVPFELLKTKHMAVQIKINGKGPYRVIFDTGAPVSLINTKTAKASGLIDKNAAGSPLFSLFGSVEQTKIKTLELGGLKASGIPVIVMDHPTVELMSQFLGPVEGIVGFPFFSRYRMTLDYQAKELTFVPNDFRPVDILQSLMTTLLNRDQPEPKVLTPGALWGLVVEKPAGDDAAGVIVKEVLSNGAAAQAGMKAGDRLLTLDDRWTDTLMDCYQAASFVKPGTPVTVVVERAGKRLELTVKPQAGI